MNKEIETSLSVLLIEDNPGDVLLVESYLDESRSYNFDLISASTLAEGMELIKINQPHVILLDMGLPDSSGLNAVRDLLTEFSESCVVVLTGNDSNELGHLALMHGAQEYLIKDHINPHALERSIAYSYERSRLTASLVEKERELKKLSIAVEQTSIAIEITDANGVIEYVNPKLCEITGYSKEELIGQPPTLFKSGRHSDQFYKDLYDTINSGKAWKGVFVNKTKDGQECYHESSISSVLDADGNIINYISFKSDISDKIAIENELKKKAHILDSIQDAVITITRKGEIKYWNKAAELLFGYTYDQSVGTTIKELDICVDKGGRVKGDIRKLIKEGAFYGEYQLKDSNGEEFQARVNASVLTDIDGRTEGLLGICTDISVEKRLEKKVAHTSQQYANLISNVPGMVFRCGYSRKFPVHFVSPGCESLTGYSTVDFDEDKGLIASIVHTENKDERWKAIREAAMKNKSYSLTYRIRTKSGQLKWVIERGTVIGGAMENSGAIEGVIYDYSDPIEARDLLMSAIMHTEISERSRISKEIHDGLQQTLTSSFLHFEKIKPDLARRDKKVFEKYTTGYDLLQSAIQETRSIAHRLLPKVIEDYSLLQSLDVLLKEFEEASFEIDFGHNLTTNTSLDKNIELVIYRITQEALTNVMKYASASNVNLQVFSYSDQVVLTIEDDGSGFEIKKTNEESFGLMSMKSRAAAVGGYIQIDSRIGLGTNILLVVPLNINNSN